jgi:hypothetical protein
MWQALSMVTDWYNSLTGLELSAEFQNLAGAVIGQEAGHQYPSILSQSRYLFTPHQNGLK